MKLETGWIVYYIVETFSPSYGYRIAKCKIRSCPHDSLKEYCLQEGGKLYWTKRKEIFITYQEAVEQAEEKADKYDSVWEKIMHRKIYRDWRGDVENRKDIERVSS